METEAINKQILIVSLPRSGSSLTARILSCMGVDFGTNLQKPDKMNPEGYYEDLEFKEFNRMIKIGGETAYSLAKGNMIQFLEERDGVVGLKNPMICYTLNHWLPLMERPMIIHLIRNHKDVEKSFSRYEAYKHNYEKKLLDWLIAKEQSLSKAGQYPRLRLEYEELISDPETEIKRIAEFVGLNYKDECKTLITN